MTKSLEEQDQERTSGYVSDVSLMKLTIIFYIGWWNECVVYCRRNATVVNNVMVIWDKFLQKVKIVMYQSNAAIEHTREVL